MWGQLLCSCAIRVWLSLLHSGQRCRSSILCSVLNVHSPEPGLWEGLLAPFSCCLPLSRLFASVPEPGVSLGMKSCSYLRLFTSALLIVVFASPKQLSSITQHNPFHGCVSSALSLCHNPDSSSYCCLVPASRGAAVAGCGYEKRPPKQGGKAQPRQVPSAATEAPRGELQTRL